MGADVVGAICGRMCVGGACGGYLIVDVWGWCIWRVSDCGCVWEVSMKIGCFPSNYLKGQVKFSYWTTLTLMS